MPIEFRCTQCGKLLRTADDTAGRQAKCPMCGGISLVPTPDRRPADFTAPGVGRANDEVNPYPTPVGYEAAGLHSATFVADRVAVPAIGLVITGGIGLLLQIVGTVVNLVMLLNPQIPRNNMGFVLEPGVSVVAGVAGIILSILVVVGGIKMKRLENYGLAMTGAIIAIIPCFSPCCFLGIPFGIWAVVVLANSQVKAAFR